MEFTPNPGSMILFNALASPLTAILSNAGVNLTEVLNQVKSAKNPNEGYDVVKNKFGNMLDMGVIDPAKVARLALINAASVGTMILTTEALVTDIPEKKPEIPGGGMPGGMDGMY